MNDYGDAKLQKAKPECRSPAGPLTPSPFHIGWPRQLTAPLGSPSCALDCSRGHMLVVGPSSGRARGGPPFPKTQKTMTSSRELQGESFRGWWRSVSASSAVTLQLMLVGSLSEVIPAPGPLGFHQRSLRLNVRQHHWCRNSRLVLSNYPMTGSTAARNGTR